METPIPANLDEADRKYISLYKKAVARRDALSLACDVGSQDVKFWQSLKIRNKRMLFDKTRILGEEELDDQPNTLSIYEENTKK